MSNISRNKIKKNIRFKIQLRFKIGCQQKRNKIILIICILLDFINSKKVKTIWEDILNKIRITV